jgi:hypothetical protein
MMLFLAFFILAALHFGGIVVLPLWLVFAPLILWFVIVVLLGAVFAWALS